MRPIILNPLFAPLETLAGVGEKRAGFLKKLGLNLIIDLLYHKPFGLKIYPKSLGLSGENNQEVCIPIQIQKINIPSLPKRPLKFIGTCQNKIIDIVYFNNAKYILDTIKAGNTYWVAGCFSVFGGKWQIVHPEYMKENKEDVPVFDVIYPLTYGINSRYISLLVSKIKIGSLPEWIPSDILKKYHWHSWAESIFKMHHPESLKDLSWESAYIARLCFDELLANQLALQILRNYSHQKKGLVIDKKGNLVKQLIESLPFELTLGQQQAFYEIENDMASNTQMNRLLQADVGSGKTIVAFLSALRAIENAYQVAFMAPTDILARQHFEKIKEFAQNLPITVELLTAKEKGKKRQEILENLKNHKIDLLIGTHALLGAGVNFDSLGFVVIDEQHKFGVEQRSTLIAKGKSPNILVLSATPIPRTLALSTFGDMDISIIKDKPKNRKPITTTLLATNKIEALLEKLKTKIETEQIYWVCPLVLESEKIDLMAANKRFESMQKYFPNQVGLLHGKMKADEKEKVMQDFITGKIRILVSTTVIEVGVDVKNATIMVIEQAGRFGLATLHQLRGRVGRGDKESYCILLYDYALSAVAKERLKIMQQTQDGFIIANQDLKLRGAGEVLGTKQSGAALFKIACEESVEQFLDIANNVALDMVKNESYKQNESIKTLLYLFQKEKAIHYLMSG